MKTPLASPQTTAYTNEPRPSMTATAIGQKEVTMRSANKTRATTLASKIAIALVLGLFLLSPLAAPAAWSQENPTINDLFAQVNTQVAAFGGMYVDPDQDTMYVYMVPGYPGDLSQLSQAMTAILGTDLPPEHNLVALQGQYTFLALKGWQDYADPEILVIPGVVSTGIDHASNRLEIGVATDEADAAVSAQLQALGIPLDAVNIVYEEPVEQESNAGCTSLQSLCRPLVGGLQIHANKDPKTLFSTFTFNATRNGIPGFVTCSHCANVPFKDTGTEYDQNELGDAAIGIEKANPPLVGGVLGGKYTCPAGGPPCRLSDSSFAMLNNGVDTKVGYIARPALNQVAWNGNDYFRIVGFGRSVQGEKITKVGRTTGRTEGSVDRVCVNLEIGDPKHPVQDPPRVMLCQNRATYKSAGMDSGSPVFLCATTVKACSQVTSADVILLGIHEAGPLSGIGFRYYSDIVLTQDPTTELGPLTKFCAPDANNPSCS